MPVNLFTIIDLYDRLLACAEQILNKGVEHVRSNGAAEDEMLNWRLIEDMQPLSMHVRIVIGFACRWPARVAEVDAPAEPAEDADLRTLQAALTQTRRFLADLTPGQFEGKDDIPLTHTLGSGATMTLPSGQWLSVFVLMNIEFHVSMTYAILRAQGVPIGKMDLFARGF